MSGAKLAAVTSFVERVVNDIPSQYRIALPALAALSLIFAVVLVREHRRSRRAERTALRDALTGLPNRAAFMQRLESEWKRSQRYKRPLGLLLIDLDDFKQINDQRGHAEGDKILKATAKSIAGRVRDTDMPARLSGDEFIVLCPETATGDLERLAALLREGFDEIPVRMSVGIAQQESADTMPIDLVSRADAAMYRDKQRRRGAKAPESSEAAGDEDVQLYGVQDGRVVRMQAPLPGAQPESAPAEEPRVTAKAPDPVEEPSADRR